METVKGKVGYFSESEARKKTRNSFKVEVPPRMFPKLSPSNSSPTLPPINFQPRALRHLSVFHQQLWSVCTRVPIGAWKRAVQNTCYVSTLLKESRHDHSFVFHALTFHSSIFLSHLGPILFFRIHLATAFNCHDYIHFSFLSFLQYHFSYLSIIHFNYFLYSSQYFFIFIFPFQLFSSRPFPKLLCFS